MQNDSAQVYERLNFGMTLRFCLFGMNKLYRKILHWKLSQDENENNNLLLFSEAALKLIKFINLLLSL